MVGQLVHARRRNQCSQTFDEHQWDLSRFAGQTLRLYVVDAETNHWGQISISEVRITEQVEK